MQLVSGPRDASLAGHHPEIEQVMIIQPVHRFALTVFQVDLPPIFAWPVARNKHHLGSLFLCWEFRLDRATSRHGRGVTHLTATPSACEFRA